MKDIKQLTKRILYGFILGIGFFGFSTTIIYAQNDNSFFYEGDFEGEEGKEKNLELAKIIQTDSINENDGLNKKTLFYKIREYFRLTGPEYSTERPAIAYIKMILNMALGLTSFISLILIIFAFYLMFFQKQEEGFTKAKKILTGVAIALIIMGFSWIIVSSFFRIYEKQVSTTTIVNP